LFWYGILGEQNQEQILFFTQVRRWLFILFFYRR